MRLLLGSLFACIVSIGVFQFRARYYPGESDCNQDAPILLSNHSWKACNVFSLEYEEARTKFRAAVKSLEGSTNVESFILPVVDDLTIDVAVLKGTGKGTIVHVSGTHGVEGYAGSAIQLAFLDYVNRDNLTSDRPTIVLVHSLNPYGMKFYRRANENNVDLNRNAIDNFDEFVKSRDPNIASYDTFRDFVSPEREPNLWDSTLGWWLGALPKVLKNGFSPMKRVLVAGQYHHPTGFSFGGTSMQPSIELIENFMVQHGLLPGEVTWIDVHTGLGKIAKDTLMFEATTHSQSSLRVYFPTAEHIVTPEVQDKKAMSGYDLTRGILAAYLQEQYPEGLFILQEFGTLPPIFVGRSLILENMIHHYGTNKAAGRALLQTSFYPQSTKWRASIVQRGVSLILQAVELSARSK
ncbi:unnamed protein product [Cylindrotheca closterium]|uniref:DUF2817 domain-containing protein n=1 Tax=Cylindrotheca closterium TaxID=2856 RepID=A0AAD2CSZ5_9STRA|nr:unnamed protein product [Cylindrotheca closterium]